VDGGYPEFICTLKIFFMWCVCVCVSGGGGGFAMWGFYHKIVKEFLLKISQFLLFLLLLVDSVWEGEGGGYYHGVGFTYKFFLIFKM
jgi:hypothetical protein